MILRNWQRPGFLTVAIVLTLSATLHAAGMLAVAPTEEIVQLPAGGQGETAALGSSFADFAAGVMPVIPAEQPAQVVNVQKAVQQAVQEPVELTSSQPLEPAVRPKPTPQTTAPAVPAVTPKNTTARAPEAAPTSPVTPQTQSATPAETVQVTEPSEETAAPNASARPQARPAQPPRQRVAQQPRLPNRQTQQPASRPAGNSDADARRGSAAGQQAGQSASAGQTQRPAAESGNAAASNYPGEVLRKITRQRRASAPRSGKVVVSFSIAGSGALASAAVLRSSGSPALDRVALDHIRRSAPFAPPPRGAQTSFTFEFVSNR